MKGSARGQHFWGKSLVVVAGLSSFLGLLIGCGGEGGETSTGDPTVVPACLPEREKAIGPVEKVSAGEVTVLADASGVKTLFIDATAGGLMEQANFPWTYINLGTASRVDITDTEADTSAGWDLAFKRPIIRTNSGAGAVGNGGAAFLKEATFDAVTKESAQSADIKIESWFDDKCVLQVDEGGYTRTTFDGWYDYGGQQTHAVTPHPGVFVVTGGDGQAYKVELESYYANPDGTDGMVSARFLLKFSPL